MISTRFVKLAVSGLAMTMSLTGGHPVTMAQSDAATNDRQLAVAADAAAKATSSLAAQNYRGAVKAAEMAVEYAPNNADYRMLLGQAYLGAGRFSSAETSFADTLTLAPGNARAALNLALTEIAQGKRDRALSTLSDYREKLAVSDYALAVGLAGDVDMAIATLEGAVRAGGGDAKTRQNLALSYAMAGQWSNARVMAMQDLSGTDVNDRIAQWAGFVRPASTFDQVASLLGVKPIKDSGQPARLALATNPDQALAAAETVPAPREEPVATAAMVVDVPAAATAPFETAAAAAPVESVSRAVIGERREIVQPLPANYKQASVTSAVPGAPIIHASATPVKRQMLVLRPSAAPSFVAAAAQPRPARSVQSGKFVVQLGAYRNAAVSRDAWKRIAPRYSLTSFDPANSAASVGGATYVRLSVGGFANRAEASGVCTRIQRVGGSCFVRGLIGDAPAQWVQRGTVKSAKPIRVASR